MADDTVLIAIKAIDDASAAINKVASSLGTMDDQIARTQNAFKGSDAANDEFARSTALVGKSAAEVNTILKAQGVALTDAERNQNRLRQAQLETIDAALKLAQAEKNLSENTDPARVAELSKALADAQVHLDQSGKAIQDLSGKVEESDKRFKIFHLTLTDIQAAFGLVQQGIGYFKQAWDFAKEGAAIERINAQFNNMAANVGVDADNLVKALDKAAHGTVDDEELMQTATRALALGLTTNTKDLVGLMEVARASSVAFGGDTATAFERISTAVENLTPRALKQAGIIVDLKSAYEAYAKAQGKIPDQLSDEEKRQALLNQVLAKGADLIKKVGDAGEDAATRMSRFEARAANLIDELKTGAVDALDPWLIKIDTLQTMLDPTASDVDKLKAAIANMNTQAVKPSKEALDAYQLALEKLEKQEKDTTEAVLKFKNAIGIGTVFNSMATAVKKVDDASKSAANGTAYWGSELQRAQLAPTYDAVDRAIRRTADAAASLRTQIALGAAQKFVLDVGISGRLVNETKQFTQSQSDLQKRLKDTEKELATLEGKQGAVDKTTVKNAMSANQLKLAYAQLAAMQGRLSKETDPTKQAELAAQIGIQQDRINGANSAVSSYIDNSKRIEQLKGTYDDLTAQVEANARAHDEASKRILFDYAQQAIAQENARNGIAGMTEDQVNALNKLAVTWGIKSQADVDAMNQMLLAAKKLAQDNSLDEFGAIAQGALEGPKKPTDDLIKMMQGMQKEAADKMPKVATSISKIKPPAKEAFDQMAKLQIQTMTSGTAMQTMTQYGVIPMIKAMDLLAISLGTVNTQLGKLPTSLPPTNLPMPTPIAPSTPPVRTRPLPGGAQRGANYIVPPGYPNDTYYQRVSSGEHVQVTPQGKSSASGLNISKVEINVGGTNASIPQIQQAVWTEMTRVIEAASR